MISAPHDLQVVIVGLTILPISLENLCPDPRQVRLQSITYHLAFRFALGGSYQLDFLLQFVQTLLPIYHDVIALTYW